MPWSCRVGLLAILLVQKVDIAGAEALIGDAGEKPHVTPAVTLPPVEVNAPRPRNNQKPRRAREVRRTPSPQRRTATAPSSAPQAANGDGTPNVASGGVLSQSMAS